MKTIFEKLRNMFIKNYILFTISMYKAFIVKYLSENKYLIIQVVLQNEDFGKLKVITRIGENEKTQIVEYKEFVSDIIGMLEGFVKGG